MNANTLISVHGYSGDARQIKNLMPFYLQHQCPVVVISPVDAPITPQMVGTNRVQFKYAGQRAYIGPLSLERQKQHLRLLLSMPHNYFLMHDSDSFCISAEIPRYLYRDIFWSNEASDAMHQVPEGWPWPRIAMQPPYFCSRHILEKIVEATEKVTFESIPKVGEVGGLQFIDHYMVRLAVVAGVPHRTFFRGCSCPTVNDAPGRAHMLEQIRLGGCMLHAVKSPEVISMMSAEYQKVRLTCPRPPETF